MSAPTTGRPLAVVTGASSGIGYELAGQFVVHGYDVVIAAEDPGIEEAAEHLRRDGRAQVRPVRVDLATFDGVVALAEAVDATGRPIDALAVAVNAGRGAGGAFVGDTDLHDELNIIDVNVTSLMPGPTDTKFFERADMTDTRVGAGSKDDPATVAAQGFEAMMKGEEKVVAGSLKNNVQTAAARFTPDRLKSEQHRKMAEPGSAD
ncbi:SDR family NAD(P)-dependent oxidoreductase [Micromonospora sp. U56]|uniref:SDR family NAD(P)-dependent oxidoreductase n=1 Tax=Micromonospora sp. U56 TaxID=2824900 RepID=UPI001B39815C|nr:SDR family NAD(P)-dependent oxidoreductase [Micromonospora sp. U56]MBQ0893094.1 SDR family NAD(P)-dependent oxidoreductase [Micromonospora sp. U56]